MKSPSRPRAIRLPSDRMEEEKPKRPPVIVGFGPPDFNRPVGQRYFDRKARRGWIMTLDGWVKLSVVTFDVMPLSKNLWVKAAKEADLTLEEWAIRALDQAAEQSE